MNGEPSPPPLPEPGPPVREPATEAPSIFRQALRSAGEQLGAPVTEHDVRRYSHDRDRVTFLLYSGRTVMVEVGRVYDQAVERALVEQKIPRNAIKAVDRDPTGMTIHYRWEGGIKTVRVKA